MPSGHPMLHLIFRGLFLGGYFFQEGHWREEPIPITDFTWPSYSSSLTIGASINYVKFGLREIFRGTPPPLSTFVFFWGTPPPSVFLSFLSLVVRKSKKFSRPAILGGANFFFPRKFSKIFRKCLGICLFLEAL